MSNNRQSSNPSEISDVYWKSQLYITLWPLWLLLLAPFFILGRYTFIELAFIPFLIIFLGILSAHFGLIFDGRGIKKSEQYSWRPLWYFYFIASFLVGVWFIAPIYLLRRRQKTGRPDIEDVKRKISLRGVFIPWH